MDSNSFPTESVGVTSSDTVGKEGGGSTGAGQSSSIPLCIHCTVSCVMFPTEEDKVEVGGGGGTVVPESDGSREVQRRGMVSFIVREGAAVQFNLL